jgi:hypothetical protein
MTWTEFKAEVERIMARDDISHDINLWYIDVVEPEPEEPPGYHSLIVTKDNQNQMSVSM